MAACMAVGKKVEDTRLLKDAAVWKEDTRAVLILFGSSGRTQTGPLGRPCTGALSSCISSKSAISSEALKLGRIRGQRA